MKRANSYARQLLAQRNIEIYAGKERILTPIKAYDIKGLGDYNPGFYSGETLVVEGETKSLKNYEELKGMGLVVISERAKKASFFKQIVNYKIVYYSRGLKHHAYIPENHYVEYDPYNNRVRLHGRNAGDRGIGLWVNVHKKQSPRGGRKLESASAIVREKKKFSFNDLINSHLGREPEPEWISIKELPIAITQDSRLLCIPKAADQPTIGIFGQRGSGKSHMFHRLIDSAMNHPRWDVRLAMLSDSQPETMTWTYPNMSGDAQAYMGVYGEAPRPLPCVFLHPNVEDITEDEIIHKEEVGYKICMPYTEIIKNYSKYIDFKGSTKWFSTIRPELLKAKNEDQVWSIIESSKIKHQQSKDTIQASLQMLLDNKMLDINTKVSAFWRVKYKDYDELMTPLAACLFSKLLPIIITNKVLAMDMFPQYFTYFVNDLFIKQTSEGSVFKKENIKLWLGIDEAQNIITKDKGITPAKTMLKRCILEGRPKRIGAIISTPFFKRLPEEVQGGILYVFSFCNPVEAGDIVRTYQMNNLWKGIIQDLPKHEFVAYTTNKFVLYDGDGKKSEEQGPFRCKALPTLSLHKRPDKGNR